MLSCRMKVVSAVCKNVHNKMEFYKQLKPSFHQFLLSVQQVICLSFIQISYVLLRVAISMSHSIIYIAKKKLV